jgi:hypothetical protein
MKRKLLKSIPVMLSSMLFFTGLHAQKLQFKFQDGSSTSYELTDLRKISYSQNQITVSLTNNDVFAQDINTIQHLRYIETNKLGSTKSSNSGSLQAVLFPNPATDVLYIQFPLYSKETALITLTDLHGKVVIEKKITSQQMGLQKEYLNLQHIPSGLYMCRIQGQNAYISKRFIKL